MILIFHVTDPNGVARRLSAVCAPSTTAAGAVNLFRQRVGVPNTVRVEVQLENSIPIRHQTAPLTSLRKQRGGVAQVLQITLWVLLTGAPEAVSGIDFGRLEEAREEDDEDDGDGANTGEEALEEMGPSWTARGERQWSASVAGPGAAGGGARIIIKGRSPSAAARGEDGGVADGENATPQTARGAAPAVPVRIARPAPLTARGPRSAAHAAPPPTTTTTTDGPRRKPSLSPSTGAAATAAGERVTKSNPHALSVSFHKEDAATATMSGAGVEGRTLEPALPSAPPPQQQEQSPCQEATAAVANHKDTAVEATKKGGYQSPALADRGHTVRRDCKLAQIMIREYPKLLDPSDAKQIVLVVKDDDRLRAMSYDPELQVPSAVEGMSDAEYSRYLSTGLVHGIELRSATQGHRIALYGAMNSLKHSCRPNASVHLDFYTEPSSASCRCAVLEGLKKGDEITYLYRHADSQAFLLLSRERRQNLLKKRYFFTCECARCQAPLLARHELQHVGSPEAGGVPATATMNTPHVSPRIPQATRDAEATLTGCFFTDSTYDRDEEKQTAISAEMKADFDALQIMSDDGLDITLTISGNVPPTVRTKQLNKLLHFLRKYASAESVLRLHEHHWRVNMVRAAYIQETVRLCAMKGVTPEVRRRDPESKNLFTPTRTVFDLCLKQLAVESLFIPAGNPHRLTTYESFQYLVSILPSSLASAVMKQARTTSRINWQELQETKEAWGLLKRTTVPPALAARTAKATAHPAPPPPRSRHANTSRSTQPTVVVSKLTVKRPAARSTIEKMPTADK